MHSCYTLTLQLLGTSSQRKENTRLKHGHNSSVGMGAGVTGTGVHSPHWASGTGVRELQYSKQRSTRIAQLRLYSLHPTGTTNTAQPVP